VFVFFRCLGVVQNGLLFSPPIFKLRISLCPFGSLTLANVTLGDAEQLECLSGETFWNRGQEKADWVRDAAVASANELALRVDEVNEFFFGEVRADALGLGAQSV
jgi:hypothetical protein